MLVVDEVVRVSQLPQFAVDQRAEPKTASLRTIGFEDNPFSVGRDGGIGVVSGVAHGIGERDRFPSFGWKGPKLAEKIEDDCATVGGQIKCQPGSFGGSDCDGFC